MTPEKERDTHTRDRVYEIKMNFLFISCLINTTKFHIVHYSLGTGTTTAQVAALERQPLG